MPKRLAITISGAVSLGSYEAGVLYEIIRAIGQHNQDPATAEDQKVFIDVLTGASAGGMTATIAAQKLLFEADALTGAYANSFYGPWVADINLDGLLAMHGDDDAVKSILSSETVIDISKRYLTHRYQRDVAPPRVKHAAAANILHLGLALSNLNGVDYGLNLRPAGRFLYTRHQDELTIQFDATDAKNDVFDLWDPLRNAAVSCGAFAFAFRVMDVIRHASDYVPEPITPIAPTQRFAYTDGGTFQNEPLGLAKNLVDKIDDHLDVDNRFYLFVAPGAKSSTANSEFNAGNADYRNTAFRLVSSILDQARFQDWIMAEKVNDQVALFNQRAIQLHSLLQGDSAAASQLAQSLQATAGALLPALFANLPALKPGQPAPETLPQARERLKKQFDKEYNSLPQNIAKTWIDSILTLETAADLATRDEMTIYGITADDTELASFELCAFAGFFDRRYREHDYNVGRQKAQAFLKNRSIFGLAAPLRYKPEDIRPIDTSLNGLKLEQMDRDARIAVRERLRNRAQEILKEAGVNPWLIGGAVRGVVDVFFIKPELNKVLKL